MINSALASNQLYSNFQVQKQENSKQTSDNQDNVVVKAKNWLAEPVDNPKFFAMTSKMPPAKISRFDNIFSKVMSIAWFALVACYVSKVLGVMGGKSGIAGKEIKQIWQNLTTATRLKDLALPEALKQTTTRLLYKISHAEEYMQKGGMNHNTILLYGPPGTGKSTYAKAIAREFPNSRFASIDLGSIQGKYVGETENRLNNAVDEVCKMAEQNPDKRVFVFFDEIDSFAMEDNGSHNQQYHASTLNTLKKCISEKLFQHNNITTIAATNVDIDVKESEKEFLQKLSKPIVDRFDEKIKVDSPTEQQFAKAISSHYQNCSNVENVLKDENSEEVKQIAQKLTSKKASFRTLESLYNMAASSSLDTTLKAENIFGFIDKLVTLEGLSKTKNQIGF
ncbi:AAA family ATPase [bacterium]|nr:AAA family ATPase [bacterium]